MLSYRHICLIIAFWGLAAAAWSQEPLYAASRSGLNLRERPDASSPILTKIPYGEKVAAQEPKDYGPAETENMHTRWTQIVYGKYTGYAAAAFLLPFIPPRFPAGDPADYVRSLGKVVGTYTTRLPSADDFIPTIEKTWYDNGISLRYLTGYESYSETIWLPVEFEKAFVLARLLSRNSELLSPLDPMPMHSASPTPKDGRSIFTFAPDRSMYRPSLIRFEWCDGGCQSVEIRDEDGETSITFAGWI